MPVVLARIDQRFIHGTILVSRALAARKVTGVILADGALCRDDTRRRIFDGALAAADPPVAGGTLYVDPAGLPALLREADSPDRRFLVIFGDVAGALAALDAGADLPGLNLGCFCSKSGDRKELFHGFWAGPDETTLLDELAARGVELYFGPLDESHKRYRPARHGRDRNA
ncbi:MAG: PTS sugar transporter subunit IIB [Deltaproteobacteria bacterium]|jgi:mannose/fructose/N-acetylgalactosamine-specific phosphotransferase system component IIB|nr:PTS sugar transporter subunit IIB [Deltaproteobacteria bacterium]